MMQRKPKPTVIIIKPSKEAVSLSALFLQLASATYRTIPIIETIELSINHQGQISVLENGKST